MAIELTQQARAHPLFPVIDFVARSIHSQKMKIDAIVFRVSRLEEQCSEVIGIQKELQQLLKEFGESTFTIEKGPFQVRL